MKVRKVSIIMILVAVFAALIYGIVYYFFFNTNEFINPFVALNSEEKSELPLEKYAIDRLSDYPFVSSQLTIEDIIEDKDTYTSYLFSYQATGGKITGQLNMPDDINQDTDVIVLIRGYVPPNIYETGVGTRSAADVFAQNGYITLAPDFLGFGGSDEDFENSWEGRFVKPIQIVELIQVIQTQDITQSICNFYQTSNCEDAVVEIDSVGIWAHSNGGQIALTVLEVLDYEIPTTLWAPVTAPFPYSVLFFSDEYQDEGKATRRWLAKFEEEYDVFDFSITQHLSKLQGPLVIHHGTNDEAALQAWSLEFIEKLDIENERREESNIFESTASADYIEHEPIEYQFYSYQGADHNMRPVWNQVINRDLEFFASTL